MKRITLALGLIFTLAAVTNRPLQVRAATAPVSQTFYVNCAARVQGRGTAAFPWNTLGPVNAHAFAPGSVILFGRGSRCQGTLAPRGSGTSAGVIRIDAYGSGALPIVDAGRGQEAIRLYNQQGWEIDDLETVGATSSGIYVGAGGSISYPLRHIVLRNLVVHGLGTGSNVGTDPAGNAAICVCGGYYTHYPNYNPQFVDVSIDGTSVYDAPTEDGIYVSGSSVRVANSVVHDVGQSGIWTGYSTNALITGNSVHNVGLDPTASGIIGVWVWDCMFCTIQHNSVWNVTSGDRTDGGAFDVDYYSHHTVVQYNYAHDVDGYCVSVFGAGDSPDYASPTSDTIIRYNICSNTGQGFTSHAGFNPEGSIYLETWNGGSLNGLAIYNNTFYASPAASVPALQEVADDGSVIYAGSLPNFFENNLVYSTVLPLIETSANSGMSVDHNLYYDPGDPAGGASQWVYRGTPLSGFSGWQAASSQDHDSIWADPSLSAPTYHGDAVPATQFEPGGGSAAVGRGVNVCDRAAECSMGSSDFLGEPNRVNARYDVGAIETQ